jgi:hypothetical protein
MITKTIVEDYYKLCNTFFKRFYKEIYGEDQDYFNDEIITYKGYPHMVYIWDMYLSIEDIRMCEEYNIPMQLLVEWYWKVIEEDIKINLYNYFITHHTNDN